MTRRSWTDGLRHRSHQLGPFRWRGSWNWKDITERSLAGFMGAAIFYLLVRLFGW